MQPRWAIFPAGYRNRFGHPKEDVVERYRVSGAQMLRTDSAGAVLVRLVVCLLDPGLHCIET